MAWDDQTDGGSMFTAYLFELLRPGDRMVGAWLRSGDRLKLAAFTDAVTPNREAPVGETVYGAPAGQWTLAREVHDAAGSPWPAGGLDLRSSGIRFSEPGRDGYPAVAIGCQQIVVAPVTLTGAVGTLMYDISGSVLGMGVCYNHWAGGPWDVTNGMLTITWHDAGICGITVERCAYLGKR